MVVSSRKLLFLGLAILAGLNPRLVHAQIPPGYEVIRLTNDPDLDGPPAINNLGHVVWSKRVNQEFDEEEIFLFDGVEVRRITNNNVSDVSPDINDKGTIVWARAKRPGERSNRDIVMWRNGERINVTDDEVWDGGPKVNNADHVVWNQFRNQGCTEADIFFHDGELVRQITNDGFSNQGPGINDYDELAWTRYNFCRNPWIGTIMLYSGGEISEISDRMGSDQSAKINNRTQVAWSNGFPDPNGVMLWTEGGSEQITNSGRIPSLNDGGAITFSRWHEELSTFQQWLWTDGEFLRLSDEPVWNAVGDINECGEVAWRRGNSPEKDIMLMRISPGDPSRDGNVDIADVQFFDGCLSGPTGRDVGCVCRALDVDRDGDVDLRDFAGFQVLFGD